MSNYICNDCNKDFNTRQHLENHINKKKKCNEKTDFNCIDCNKYFKSRYYLKQHQESCKEYKNSTIETNIDTIELKNAISFIINSNESNENKVMLLNKFKTNMSNDEINILLKSSITNDGKISIFYSTITKINQNNENHVNSHNTTNTFNNIQVNQFGKEKIDYLDDDYFKSLLQKKNIENAYINLTKDIHLRLDHPENRNIKVTNINSKNAYIFENGKWRGIAKKELKEKLHIKNSKLIKIHCDSLKDILTEDNIKNVKIFLGRDIDEDPVMKDINEKMILLFYAKDTI